MQPKPKHAQWNPAISEPFRSWEPWWELSIHENPLPTKQLTIADPWPLLVHQDLSFWPRDSPSARPAMTFLVHCFDLDSEAARLTFFPGSSSNRGRIWSSSLLQASYQVCALTLHRHGKAWSKPLPGHRQQGHADIKFLAEINSLYGNIWVWVNTYRYIFSGMNIHLPAILGFTRYQSFDPSPYGNQKICPQTFPGKPILRLPWAMPSDTWERCTPPPYLHERRLLKPGECQDGTARCLASENAARKTVPFRKNSHKLNENNLYRLNTNWIHKQKTYNIYRLKSKEFCRTCPSPSAPAALSRNSSRQWARRAQRGTAAPVAFGVPLHPRRIQ